MIHYKKHTGRPVISYDDAVEEAICWGWIDSKIKRLDNDRYIRCFTPRNKTSVWSKVNLARARKMMRAGKMTAAGRTKMKKLRVRENERVELKSLSVPLDLKKSLKARGKAYEVFTSWAPSMRKMYLGWILDAKRPETRSRRIKKITGFAARNKKPGLM